MRTDHSSYEERVRAVKSYIAGGSVSTIAENLGRRKASVYKWIKIYEKKKSYEGLAIKNLKEDIMNLIQKLKKNGSRKSFQR